MLTYGDKMNEQDLDNIDEQTRRNENITGILINPHFCSLDEFNELLDYLKNNKWDVRFIEVIK